MLTKTPIQVFREDILADFSEFRRISKENGSFWRRACPGGARRAIRGARAVADVLVGHGTGGGAPEAPAARTRAQVWDRPCPENAHQLQ